MPQTEIMFDGGIPMLEGTWYNPKTGDSITVRDTLFEDNNLVVMTTDGRRIPYTQMEKYVKSDKPLPKQPKINPIVKDPAMREELAEPATWDDLILDEDKAIADDPLNTPLNGKRVKGPFNPNASEPKSENEKILERALSKFDNTIEVSINISWQAPKESLKSLIDMFDLKNEDIAKYLLSKAKKINLEEPAKQAVENILLG